MYVEQPALQQSGERAKCVVGSGARWRGVPEGARVAPAEGLARRHALQQARRQRQRRRRAAHVRVAELAHLDTPSAHHTAKCYITMYHGS